MGCSAALLLAEAGFEVALFDAAPAPMSGASRWNEGKIHLGFLYAADPSLETARRVIPGGLAFAPLLARLTGRDIGDAGGQAEDVYLVLRDSVVTAEAMAATHAGVCGLLRDAGLADAATRRLSAADLAAFSGSDAVTAGFAVPERSVDTRHVADALAAAVVASPRIDLRCGTRVLAARPCGPDDGPWQVETDTAEAGGRFDWVINALWHGRPAVDRTAGLAAPAAFTQRYRVALFLRAPGVEERGAVLSVGPFGDMKAYGDGRYYLSWYLAGLLVESTAEEVTEPPRPDPAAVIAATRAGLVPYLPGAARVLDAAVDAVVAGGWVFALGRGSLSDPASALHRRDAFGIRRRGRYLSVDTGKYSTAPWLALRVADALAGAA